MQVLSALILIICALILGAGSIFVIPPFLRLLMRPRPRQCLRRPAPFPANDNRILKPLRRAN
ncbi:hypothetical protein [Methylobacterium nigriterrae]|uniref:hypothetical protein n=1 Tax=Methylobacterium nigriterrae TaxID=3127512 RepID=UPI00301413D4